jgi:hypothetical protein
MSINTDFITVQTLQDRTGISNAIDPAKVTPMIKLTQDIFLRPALGSALYSRLQAGVLASNLTTAETTLLNNYVTDCLVWGTMANLPMALGYQFFAKGPLQKTSENSNAPVKNELDSITQYYQNFAEFYKQELINYLKTNYTSFSQYANPGCGWDVVKPVSTGYDCPIYLEDHNACGIGTISSTVSGQVYPSVAEYVATGGESSFTLSAISGKIILLAFRAGIGRGVVSTVNTDTNYLQVVGSTVTLPTGDIAIAGEVFKFLYT